MSSDQAARAARARARATWTGGVRRMTDLPEVDVIDLPSEVLFGLVQALTLEAWALGGKSIPTYARSDMPGRVVRSGDQRAP